MKTSLGSQFSSVWGKVTHTRIDPKNKEHLLVTIAEQALRLERTTDDGMEKMGLMRLTKRNKLVFLIFWENERTGIHHICAGWNNPDGKTARKLQVIIAENAGDFYQSISKYFPTWKSSDLFGDDEDEFIEVNEPSR